MTARKCHNPDWGCRVAVADHNTLAHLAHRAGLALGWHPLRVGKLCAEFAEGRPLDEVNRIAAEHGITVTYDDVAITAETTRGVSACRYHVNGEPVDEAVARVVLSALLMLTGKAPVDEDDELPDDYVVAADLYRWGL